MKNILKYFAAFAVSALTLSACIKETFPMGGTATADQIGASASALEASVNGIPAQMCQGYLVYGDQVDETDMAFPQFMIGFTELLGDLYPCGDDTGFDWYSDYNNFVYNWGETSVNNFLPWFTCYQFVKSANDVIASVNLEDPEITSSLKGIAGQAYACRAFDYYLLTVMFEPVENIYTDCSSVLGLTVPKVDEKSTPETAKNSPRLTHDEMTDFIYSDLAIAEECLKDFKVSSNQFPCLAVAYGIHAKVAMWDEDYETAAKYARLAIDEWGGTPMTKEQLTDLNTGFNTANQAWMWYTHYSAENMENLANLTGWISSEADWSYSAVTCPSIDRSLYDRINASDYRKEWFLSPSKEGYKTVRDEQWISKMPPYLAFKFRCCNGDYKTYSVGGACDVPIMRVEEMYLIEAEAVGMTKGVAAGNELLVNFMKEYRDPEYSFNATTERSLQIEVLTQERIEFWGEGWGFPNAKRIKPNVIQNYEGTNAPADSYKINCKDIKPNWNFVIPRSEIEANSALKGKNNPEATKAVVGPVAIGTFAEPK